MCKYIKDVILGYRLIMSILLHIEIGN